MLLKLALIQLDLEEEEREEERDEGGGRRKGACKVEEEDRYWVVSEAESWRGGSITDLGFDNVMISQ